MRERLSMDKDWLFHYGELQRNDESSHDAIYGNAKAGGLKGAASIEWNDNEWDTVQLPHDWSYQLPFDREHGIADFGYKQRGTGWYRKKFKLSSEDEGKQLILEFDGIATHATIYLNGSILERNFCGYTSFAVDITDRAFYGDRPNLLVVKVDASISEGWWYEGAGIYRHVWLTKTAPMHIDYRGIWVRPEKQDEKQWYTHIETKLSNDATERAEYKLISQIYNDKKLLVAEESYTDVLEAGEAKSVNNQIAVQDPALWDVDAPHLYELHSIIECNGQIIDRVTTNFGYRTIRICPDKGFYLNERQLKLKGTCNHQDHAGVGVALPDALHEYRIKRLKDMGSNAYRCAHHNPTPELLEACDRLGMLVMDENRNFDSSREGILQVENMVTRDRNHPSVIFYSLFNEEPLQGTPIGRKMFQRMKKAVQQLDSTRPILGAMHGGVMEDNGIADISDITGFNYMNGAYDKFREKHPQQPMIGSETVSAFSTRNCYESNTTTQVFDSYDRERANWGNTVRESWKTINTRDYVMGTFVWTGFDYRGEPTPYEWPSVSTHFGIMDTCGFPKDAYYLYQAFWLDEPILHILPHWNWQGKEGQSIEVMAHTNCDEVALYINGKLVSRQSVDIYEQLIWEVPYEPGVVKAEGYHNQQLVKVTEVRTTGEAVALKAELQKSELLGNGKDATVVNIYAVDKDNNFVPTDNRLLSFSIQGNGKILGSGNGNPNSHESDVSNERHLFNGCMQLIVQSTAGTTPITLQFESDGLVTLQLPIPVIATDEYLHIPTVSERYINEWIVSQTPFENRPDANMEIATTDMNSWEKVDVSFGARETLKGIDGYVIYRNRIPTSFVQHEQDPYLWFHSICGNAEIFINEKLVLKQEFPWSMDLEVPLSSSFENENETITITVLLEINKEMYSPGVNGAVSIRTK